MVVLGVGTILINSLYLLIFVSMRLTSSRRTIDRYRLDQTWSHEGDLQRTRESKRDKHAAAPDFVVRVCNWRWTGYNIR